MGGRARAALRHRDLRLLLASFTVDAVGNWAAATVLTVYVYESSRSLLLLALLPSTRWVVGLLAAPVAGVIADRFDRRRVMIASALATGLITTTMTVVVATRAPIVVVFALQVLTTLASAPAQPAAGGLTPEVVDEASLPAANGLFALLENVVLVVGPALGGALLLIREPAIGIGVNAASFFVAAALATALRVRSRGDAEAGTSIARQFLVGVTALRTTPTAAVLLLFVALDTVLAGANTVLYVVIGQHAGLGDGGYGALLVASAVGGILGALAADRLSAARRLAPVIVGGVLVQALPLVATAFTTIPPVVVALQLVSGAGMVTVDVIGLTALQREVPGSRLGRVLGLMQMVGLASSVLGTYAAAGLVGTAGYRTGLVVLGVLASAMALGLAPVVVRVDRLTAARAVLLTERAVLLGRIPLLAPLPQAALQRLASLAEPSDLAPGQVLVREGDDSEELWVLAEGGLAVTTDRPLHEPLPVVQAPDVVGEIGVLHHRPRTATLTAIGQGVVWRLSAADFLVGLETPQLSTMLTGAPAARLRRTHPDIAGG